MNVNSRTYVWKVEIKGDCECLFFEEPLSDRIRFRMMGQIILFQGMEQGTYESLPQLPVLLFIKFGQVQTQDRIKVKQLYSMPFFNPEYVS